MKNDTGKELVFKRFVQRESGLRHPTYDTELAFYQLVQSGDTERLMEALNDPGIPGIAAPERGELSEDPLRNFKYHFVVTAAMISRFCIEGGLDERISYMLSDIYIKRADKAVSMDELHALHEELVLEYAERMQKGISREKMSIHCIKAMDYISDNLHAPLTTSDVADYLELDRTYFCKLFKKETGMGVSEYIRHKKIQTAQSMLIYTDFSCSEIAQYFGFSSHSHFSDCFKTISGCTPTEYRMLHYRKHFTE